MSLETAIQEHAAALLELAAAIRSAGAGAAVAAPAGTTSKPAATATSSKTDDKKTDDAGSDEAIFWANNTAKTFGRVDSQAEYDKLKKKDAKIVKITETAYAKKVKEAEEAAAAAAAAGSEGSGAPAATKDELVKAAQAFLPKDLDDDLKEERRGFVKSMLDRFGGSKITEIPEDHWGLVVNLIQRKMADQDVDPSDAEYEEIDEESLV